MSMLAVPVTARSLDVDESGDMLVTTTKVVVIAMIASNTHATDKRYLKLYDKATAPAETDTPALGPVLLSPSDTDMYGIPGGMMVFQNGIGVRATTGLADADVGAPGANEVLLTVFYRAIL